MGTGCLSALRGNNRATVAEVSPSMADAEEKGERRPVESRALENQPEAQAARVAGVHDVKAAQALNQNAHNGSAGGDQNESIEIVMPKNGGGYDVLASRIKAAEKPEEPEPKPKVEPVTVDFLRQKAQQGDIWARSFMPEVEQAYRLPAGATRDLLVDQVLKKAEVIFRPEDRVKAQAEPQSEDQSQTSTGAILAKQAEKNPAVEPVKALYDWAYKLEPGPEKDKHQQLAREQLVALEPQTKGVLDALDQRRQLAAEQEDCAVHELPRKLKEPMQGHVSYPEKEIEGLRRLTPDDLKKLAKAMEAGGPAAEDSIKQTTQEILVRTGESSRDTMLAGINLVVGLLKYDRDLIFNPAQAREDASKAGEGLGLLLIAGAQMSVGISMTAEEARQSGDYSLPLRRTGEALNRWYEKQTPADQMAIVSEISAGFGVASFSAEANKLKKPGAFMEFLKEGIAVLPRNPEAERKALEALTRVFKGRQALKEAVGLGKDYTFAMSKTDDFDGLGKPGKGRESRPVHERDIVNPVDRAATQEQKVAQLMALTEENKPLVEKFLREVDTALGTKSEVSIKQPQDILNKANRPLIKDTKDWFDVEHVRDSFRFKTPVENLNELPRIVEHLTNSGFEIVKLDLDKLIKPKGRGWRMAAIDLKAPNGQILEYQILPREMNEAGKIEHQMYKRWREQDVSSLSKQEQKLKERADAEAVDLYSDAWESYLGRTGQTKKEIGNMIKHVYEKLGHG